MLIVIMLSQFFYFLNEEKELHVKTYLKRLMQGELEQQKQTY